MTTRCHHHMEADPETFPWHMLASTRQGCHFCRRCLVREEAILCEHIDLRIFGRPETLAIEDEKALKNISLFQLDKPSVKFAKQINADRRADQELCAPEDRKRRILSSVTQ